MTCWRSPAEDTKSKTSPSPSPTTLRQIKSHRRRIVPGSFIKLCAVPWAQSSPPPSVLGGCAGGDRSIYQRLRCLLLLWRGAGPWQRPGRAAKPTEGVWCWFPGISEKFPVVRRPWVGEGRNATSEEGDPSLRSIPPTSAIRSFSDMRQICNSIGIW